MSQIILNWSEAFAAGPEACGGKGWNLARLQRYGFAVPDGFVIHREMYHAVVGNADVMTLINRLREMDVTRSEAATVLEHIREIITNSTLPPACVEALDRALARHDLNDAPLAVRSSATQEDSANASFAGVHDSVLNVRGRAAIEHAILQCYASLWTPRAVSYRRKMNVDEDAAATAVVVMTLLDATSAGIAFSCDPSSGRTDITVINANYGLGDSVVSGAVEPDCYHVRSHHCRLVSKTPGSKEKFTVTNAAGGTRLQPAPDASDKLVLCDREIEQLARLCQRVFYALGHAEQHQDIEWAYDGETFWLVQARPVTALPRHTCEGLRNQPEFWSNGNFRDGVPMVLPMINVSFMRFHIDHILIAPFQELDFSMPDGLQFMRLFQGRAYCNAALMQWLWFDAIGFPPARVNRNMGGHQGEIIIDQKTEQTLIKRAKRGMRILKCMRLLGRFKKQAAARYAQEAAFVDDMLNSDMAAMSDYQLAALYAQVDDRLADFAPTFIMLTATSGAYSTLTDILEKYFPDEAEAVANGLLSGYADLTTANNGYQLFELAECVEHDPAAQAFFRGDPFVADDWIALPDNSLFKKRFQALLAEQGHRAVYELDLRNPRWREDPSYLLGIVKQNIGSETLPRMRQTQATTARETWAKVRTRVPWPMRRLIKHFVKEAAQGAANKEMAKSVYVRLMWPLRTWALAVGDRLARRGVLPQRDDVFHCADVELVSLLNGEWSGEGLATLLNDRKARHVELEVLTTPDVIVDDEPQYSHPPRQYSGSTLHGMGVAAGCAQGRARKIRSPHQATIKTGDVLVAPSTDPAWTPLFLNAAAIVMETGGQLSHGAIVAREYGIPAVVNVPGLFERIEEGDQLVVDGDRGLIELGSV